MTKRNRLAVLGVLLLAGVCVSAAWGKKSVAVGYSASAPDFPPGTFTDGGHYSVNEFRGKVLVLYFGCPVCPRNRGSIPDRNKVVEQFRGRPVKFLAITPAAWAECRGYASDTRLEMPCFADGTGVMQQRYGTNISLNNIWQVRVIGPTGLVVGYDMSADAIEKAVANVKWKYKDDGYDPKLSRIVDLLEWNQFEPAMQLLRPFLKQKNKTGDSARALYDKVKTTEGAQWAAEAESAGDDKVKAFDLATRLAACFPDDDLGKHAAESIKTLRKEKAVVNELAARQMYAQLNVAMSKAMPNQKPQLIGYCLSIAKKYPESPTGRSAEILAKELETASVAE